MRASRRDAPDGVLASRGSAASASAEAKLAEYVPALRAAARGICRNPAECEDLIQDTFERALRYMAAGREEVVNLRAWLVRILRNVFIDRVRAERSPPVEIDDSLALETDAEPEPLWASLTLADVRAACAMIDPHLREVFSLHYLEGLSYREISARLSVPENTVGTRLFRARKALRNQLLAFSSEEGAR